MIHVVEKQAHARCYEIQDPTGSIGAGIHVNVFQNEEGVSPGAVLMLEQVISSFLTTAMILIVCDTMP